MKLFEEQIGSEKIFDGKIINVKKDKVKLSDGTTSYREVVEHSGGVCVAALDNNDNLLFVKQFRYPYNDIILEIPAGKLNYNESHFDCGKRELLEETGYNCSTYKYIATLYPSPGYVSEIIHIYFAADLTLDKQYLDKGEFLEVCKIPLDKAFKMVINNEIFDAKTQVAILKVKYMKDNNLI